jgi:hypothetical protein
MHLEGKITNIFDSSEIAGNVARLIQIDNEIAPKTLKIQTSAEGPRVITMLASDKASTFFATIDDLVFSEKLISEVLEI